MKQKYIQMNELVCVKYKNNKNNTNTKKTYNILIIDSDINMSKSLKEYLEMRDHTVKIVDEGTQGISLLNNNIYDIVFIDYNLKNDGSPIIKKNLKKSKMNACILTECIKEVNTDIKLIFAYSNKTNKINIQKCKIAGMDGIIKKSINLQILDKLMATIENQNKINTNELYKLSNNNSIKMF
jgi:CheY-like chemotaxis protein